MHHDSRTPSNNCLNVMKDIDGICTESINKTEIARGWFEHSLNLLLILGVEHSSTDITKM